MQLGWVRGYQVAVDIVVSNLRRGRSSAGASSGVWDQNTSKKLVGFLRTKLQQLFFLDPWVLVHADVRSDPLIFECESCVAWSAPFPSRRRQSLSDSRAIRGMQQGTYALRGRVHRVFPYLCDLSNDWSLSIKDPLYTKKFNRRY